MEKFDHLLELPGPPQYQAYLKERLETLSVRENYALAAVLQRAPPRDTEEAVDCLNSLDACDICPAGSYEELGRLNLKSLKVPEEALLYGNLEQLGHRLSNCMCLYIFSHPHKLFGVRFGESIEESIFIFFSC